MVVAPGRVRCRYHLGPSGPVHVAVDIDGQLRLTEPEGGYPQRQVGTAADVAYFWRQTLGTFGGLYCKYTDEAKLMEHSETLRRSPDLAAGPAGS